MPAIKQGVPELSDNGDMRYLYGEGLLATLSNQWRLEGDTIYTIDWETGEKGRPKYKLFKLTGRELVLQTRDKKRIPFIRGDGVPD